MNNEQQVALKAVKDVLATYKDFASNGQPLELEKANIEWLQDKVDTLEEALNQYQKMYEAIKFQVEQYYEELPIDSEAPSESQIFEEIFDNDRILEASNEMVQYVIKQEKPERDEAHMDFKADANAIEETNQSLYRKEVNEFIKSNGTRV